MQVATTMCARVALGPAAWARAASAAGDPFARWARSGVVPPLMLALSFACSEPSGAAPPDVPDWPDCRYSWDKSCPPLDPWQPVPCEELDPDSPDQLPEARIHIDRTVWRQIETECGDVRFSLPHDGLLVYVHKELRARDDCRRCQVLSLHMAALRDLEVDIVARRWDGMPRHDFGDSIVHPDRPFYPYTEMEIERAIVRVQRAPDALPATLLLDRRCPDGTLAEECERLRQVDGHRWDAPWDDPQPTGARADDGAGGDDGTHDPRDGERP